MGNQVYANMMEVSCKAAGGKSICAFPDVCMSPPQTPATPPGIPIPDPNTGMASDTSDGSSSVKISGQEIMLKNKSYFKKSSGDEAGAAPMKNLITHKTTGKVYFAMWSMDVMIEGENVVRHFDLTTHNHGSTPPGTPPTIHIDEIAIALPGVCRDAVDTCNKACEEGKGMAVERGAGTRSVRSCSDECRKSQKCILIPKAHDEKWCCPEGVDSSATLQKRDTLRTGHHLIEDQLVKGNPNFPWYSTNRGKPPSNVRIPAELPGRNVSSEPQAAGVNDAPTVCTNSFPTNGTPHQGLHHVQGVFLEHFQDGGSMALAGESSNGLTYGKLKEHVVMAHWAEFGAGQ
jgi:hypothetical protein